MPEIASTGVSHKTGDVLCPTIEDDKSKVRGVAAFASRERSILIRQVAEGVTDGATMASQAGMDRWAERAGLRADRSRNRSASRERRHQLFGFTRRVEPPIGGGCESAPPSSGGWFRIAWSYGP
jgi:hypothetical protein